MRRTDAESAERLRVAVVGPVYPYRAGIAYCTTRLAEELTKEHEVTIASFSRQFPKRFYPGGDDIDETLRDRTPKNAHFVLDIVDPLSWIATAWALRREKPDAVIFVWWIWVWAIPYRVMASILSRHTRVILQCHNIGDKEPAAWKRALTNLILRRADTLVTHAQTEAGEAWKRSRGGRTIKTFLPVHELGGRVPSRGEARAALGITQKRVALFFGHIRPFKALDVVLRAWSQIGTDALLLVAGEAWWESAGEYRKLAHELGLSTSPRETAHAGTAEKVRFDFRFIPDAEIATYFAATDVVLAPYRIEAQSGVALTAFHFARPVIASTVGGLPEVIQPRRNGLLVPPDDPVALAKAVDEFFSSGERPAMEEAAAAAARRYSWEEYAKVFSRLVKGL